MNLRSKLIVAFVALAVAPLAGIVASSYVTTQKSFREAAEADARELAGEIADRLNARRAALDEALDTLGSLEIWTLVQGDGDVPDVYLDLVDAVDALAVDVEALELRVAGSPPSDGRPSAERRFLVTPSRALARAVRRMRGLAGQGISGRGMSGEDLAAMVAQVVRPVEDLPPEELAALEAARAGCRRILGTDISIDLISGDRTIGRLGIPIAAGDLLRETLAATPRRNGEIPFARDGDGRLIVAEEADRASLHRAGIGEVGDENPPSSDAWVVARSGSTASDLILGVARPLHEALELERSRALQSFARGLALVAAALVGILWIASRLTRNLWLLTEGADRIAGGDLTARVPIRSRDELGHLAQAFNRMALSLSEQKQRIFLGERKRREEEVARRLVEAENERKTRELEDARELQISLLPREIPKLPGLDLAVALETATEVGGDTYDFRSFDDGSSLVAIGDATGHGAKAGVMVTFIKGLMASAARVRDPARFLDRATRAVRNLQIGRLHMALTLVHVDGRKIRVASAGMPPAVVSRADGSVEELELGSMPLGGLTRFPYRSRTLTLEPGDRLLLMTDGLPELLDPHGAVFGYERLRSAFADLSSETPDEIVAGLIAAAHAWRGDRPLPDDLTLLVLGAC